MWNKIVAWVSARGGWIHVALLFWIGAVTCYGAVPAFHQLVITVWAITPSPLRLVLAALIGVVGWLVQGAKTVQAAKMAQLKAACAPAQKGDAVVGHTLQSPQPPLE